MGRRFTRGGLFLVRQALDRHDWGFEGLRAEREGCAAGTATHSSKLRMERNWQSQSFLSDHRTCGHFPPTEWCWGFEGPARKGQRRRAIIFRSVALCVWRVDPAPNDPVVRGRKGGLGADADLLSQIFGAKTQIIGSH